MKKRSIRPNSAMVKLVLDASFFLLIFLLLKVDEIYSGPANDTDSGQNAPNVDSITLFPLLENGSGVTQPLRSLEGYAAEAVSSTSNQTKIQPTPSLHPHRHGARCQTKRIPSYEVIPITEPLDLSEGPHWDSKAQALYFINLYQGEIHRYVPENNLHTSAVVGTKNDNKSVSFIVPVENQDDCFVIGYGGDLAYLKWDGTSSSVEDLTILDVLEKSYPAVRLNDGKVSPSGIIFAGSMAERVNGSFPKNLGHLFAYDPKNKVSKVLLSDIGIGNGLAWNAEETVFYYIDSLWGQVRAYDYNAEDISLSNERVIFDFASINVNPPELLPDGMTIDISGNLWVTLNNHGKIYQINPETKVILNEIDFNPTKPVSSVAFGGPDLQDLYVTSIRRDLNAEEQEQQPFAGCVFKVTGLGTSGIEGKGVNLF